MSSRGWICVMEHLTTTLDEQGRRVATVSSTAQHIAGWLSWHNNGDGRPSWAAQETIARESGTSRSTVIRACKELAKAGVVEYQPHGGKNGTNLYRVLLCPSCSTVTHKDGSTPLSVLDRHRGSSKVTQPLSVPQRNRNTGEHRQRTTRERAGSTPDGAGRAHAEDPQPIKDALGNVIHFAPANPAPDGG